MAEGEEEEDDGEADGETKGREEDDRVAEGEGENEDGEADGEERGGEEEDGEAKETTSIAGYSCGAIWNLAPRRTQNTSVHPPATAGAATFSRKTNAQDENEWPALIGPRLP